jgi:hypothetical protein
MKDLPIEYFRRKQDPPSGIACAMVEISTLNQLIENDSARKWLATKLKKPIYSLPVLDVVGIRPSLLLLGGKLVKPPSLMKIRIPIQKQSMDYWSEFETPESIFDVEEKEWWEVDFGKRREENNGRL